MPSNHFLRHNVLFLFTIFLFSLPAFGQEAIKKQSAPLSVVASIRPLALIVDEIGGDLVETRILLESAASPHDFSLTIGQALMLNDADLLLWVGPSFETFLKKGVSTPTKLAMLNDGDAHSDHDHHHDEVAQHPWLSSAAVSHYAEAIAKTLIEHHPEARLALQKRLTHFQTTLVTGRARAQALLAPYATRPFAVFHNAYSELVEEFSILAPLALTQVPHERVSAKRLTRLGAEMGDVQCILADQAESAQAQRYAALFEKDLVKVDLLAKNKDVKTYDEYLVAMSRALLSCFQSSAK